MKKILKRNRGTIIIILIIFVVALFLRTVKLPEFPVGFQMDEAIIGVTGNSILHTGKDTNGVFLPMYTEVFGDYIPVGYHVLTIPFIQLFGLSVFATRLPGAIIGALTIFSAYLFAWSLFRNKTISLLFAGILAISPWSIILSRVTSEASVSVFFILLGFALVFQSIRNQKLGYLFSGGIVLLISFFFYHTPRLFVPLMFIGIIVFLYPQLRSIKNKIYVRAFFATFILLSLTVVILVLSFKGATARFDQVSIFKTPETRLVMEEQIREDGMEASPLETRMFHNKLINNALAFSQNYLEYFSPNNVFIKSGVPRILAIPNVGLILLTLLPFFIFGLGRLLFEKDKLSKVVYIWLLIAPITAALTVDDVPNMRRASIMFPVIELIAAYGLYNFLRLFNGRVRYVLIIVIGLLVCANFIYFTHQYFVHAKTHQAWYRNNGFGEMMKEVNKNYSKYDKVVLTKSEGGYPLVLFYSNYDPATYIKEGSPKDADYKGFGKYIFVPNECPSVNLSVKLPITTKVLYVDRGNCPAPVNRTYTEIKREDGSIGFRVVY